MTPRTATPRTARTTLKGLVASLGLLALAGAAQAAGIHGVSHDGFIDQGDHLVFVGLPQAGEAAKTRAQVGTELQAARAKPVLQDGWRQEGDSLRFVGIYPAGSASKSRMAVLDELRAWKSNPVHADGWVSLGDSVSFQGVATEFKLSAMPAETVQR
ncbi:DUF4148 domain-containing protein [Piscinibacter sp. Jin2]|uniref:DUF4148 domain-containing protein n=1 Tax=Aquariibacter lacus TaxID=2801332 RepID=A0A9X0XEY9_9BURK|nr:DUF4148 domain-containing protein [Piscinibacter lacus]MBL0720715.1 DUF4148 domain-containing protein [Piscinibacter lacus]